MRYSPFRTTVVRNALRIGTAVLGFSACMVAAQTYPSKPVTVIVPYAPGGSVDSIARMAMQSLSARLGQVIIIENVPGAGGVIGTAKAAGASPDGYTLIFSVESAMLIAKLVTPSTVKYDGLKDFVPISLVGTTPLVLVGKPDLPAKNATELAALLKNPDSKLSYATSGVGSSLQMGGELVNQALGAKMSHVPYKVGAQIVTDLAGNHVDLAVLPLSSVREPARIGRIRAYGVMAPNRWASAPEIPSLAEVPAFKDVDVLVWFGLFAPAKTDAAIVSRLGDEMNAVLSDPEVLKKLAVTGLEPARMNPRQLATFLQREHDKFANIVKVANIKAD